MSEPGHATTMIAIGYHDDAGDWHDHDPDLLLLEDALRERDEAREQREDAYRRIEEARRVARLLFACLEQLAPGTFSVEAVTRELPWLREEEIGESDQKRETEIDTALRERDEARRVAETTFELAARDQGRLIEGRHEWSKQHRCPWLQEGRGT